MIQVPDRLTKATDPSFLPATAAAATAKNDLDTSKDVAESPQRKPVEPASTTNVLSSVPASIVDTVSGTVRE